MNKYGGLFTLEKVSKDTGIETLHGKPLLYLAFLVQKSLTCCPVQKAENSLSWAHQQAGEEDPTDCSLVKQFLAGAQQMLAHKTQKRAHHS